MIYIVTGLSFNIREFNGVFRTREEAETFIQERALANSIVSPEAGIEIGPEKKKVYIAQRLFRPEDLFGYAGVFEDYDSALRESGGEIAGVLTYEL